MQLRRTLALVIVLVVLIPACGPPEPESDAIPLASSTSPPAASPVPTGLLESGTEIPPAVSGTEIPSAVDGTEIPSAVSGTEIPSAVDGTEIPSAVDGTETPPPITTYPADGGDLHDLDHPLYVRFAQAPEPGQVSFDVSPDPGGWSVSWQDDGRQIVLNHATPFESGIPYELAVEVDPGDIRHVTRFRAYGPTSVELIDVATAQGELDLDTAWTYRLQAFFEPQAVPPNYQSPTSMPDGTVLLRDFLAVQDQLAPETLEALTPYLVRPDQPDSIFARRMRDQGGHRPQAVASRYASDLVADTSLGQGRPPLMHTMRCADGISVWYESAADTYKAKAQETCRFLEHWDMYSRFLALMGREPIPDAEHCQLMVDETEQKQCYAEQGGSVALDIYLVPGTDLPRSDGKHAMGLCRATEYAQQTPAYILVSRDLSTEDLGATLAHELFHAFQFAFDAGEQDWWMEGTATWAEDFIDPKWNTEQDYLEDVFDRSQHSQIRLTDTTGYHAYAAYLFPFYLSQNYGNDVIASIWRHCINQDALAAVDAVVDGGLDERFKEFSLFNLDLGLLQGLYNDAGVILELYGLHGVKEWEIETSDETQELELELPPLSARYILVKNQVDDTQTPSVRFLLDEFEENEKLTVQALVDPVFEDTFEDWSDRDQRRFCLNREDEYFGGIALVVASAERGQTLKPTLQVRTTNECVVWEGSFRYNQTIGNSWSCHDDNFSLGVGVNATFELAFVQPSSFGMVVPGQFVARDVVGTYSIDYSYSHNDDHIDQACSGSFWPTSFRLEVDEEAGTYEIWNYSFYLKDGTCGRLQRTFLEFGDAFYLGDAGFQTVAEGTTDGQTISGSWHSPVSCAGDWCGYYGWATPRECGISVTWNLTKHAEPPHTMPD